MIARITSLLISCLLMLCSAWLVSGCDDTEVYTDPGPSSAKPPTPPPGGAGAPGAGASPSAKASSSASAGPLDLPPLPTLELTEADFTENDRSRDPFRNYASQFVAQAKGRTTVQRVVMAERFALDELKPAGIVSRGDSKALLVDPTGLGWIVKVGDYVGKPELVHTGGPQGTDVAINWRVDRIRENDIVFLREDPSHPEIPPTTRAIVLYPVDQNPSSMGAQGPG